MSGMVTDQRVAAKVKGNVYKTTDGTENSRVKDFEILCEDGKI